ncbi:MAG: hypothetical protein IJK63_06475 [Oscillospiraceae bacterium]|nr:hypothetical protein [Oscillospiraceae bacterium]MBQ7737603.1 hypothetical protein [Oscillospiraceae bacterium]
MKRSRQALALLLALVLALSLAPLSASADPPAGDCRYAPDGEHHWVDYGIVKEPTCTDPGVRGWACKYCYTPYYEDVPALGHDWREGEVIESDGQLGPQKVRYVCNRCYEVKVETVQPSGSSVLNTFRNIPPDADLDSPIHVIQQPEGGRLDGSKGQYVPLTLEVEGGVPPYVYEWHIVDKGVTEYLDGSPVGYAVHSNSRRATEETNRRRAAFYESYINYATEHFGWADEQGAMRAWTELQMHEYGDYTLGTYETPDYTAEIGNCYYYCVIHDSALNEARTVNVFVSVPLYIDVQPCDNDFRSGRCFLSCEAAGGSGEYSYTWYCGDFDHELSETGSTVEVFEPGEYFCVVRDGEEEITSRTVTVSEGAGIQLPEEGEAPVITEQPADHNLPYMDPPYEGALLLFLLNCVAVNEMGDDSTLVYEWEYKDFEKRAWTFLGEGSVLPVEGMGGVFRCKVTDQRNGLYTYSREATVAQELVCLDLHYSSYYMPGYSSAYKIEGTIAGGLPPYEVYIIQARPKDSEYSEVLTPIHWVQEVSGEFSQELNPIFYQMYDYVKTEHGFPEMGRAVAYYSIWVRDAVGHECYTDPIQYPVY